MNLNFTAEYEDFRADVRAFLDKHKADAPSMANVGLRS